MENGNGSHASNGNGHANGHVEPLRPVYYRTLGRGARVRFSPAARVSRCPCRATYTYSNDLVLSIDDGRRQLMNTNRALLQGIEELSAMVDAQGARIEELEGTVVDEMARTEAARNELQRVRARLTRIGKKIRDWASGILIDTTTLIEEVIEAFDSLAREGTPEKEPFKEDPEKDDQASSSDAN